MLDVWLARIAGTQKHMWRMLTTGFGVVAAVLALASMNACSSGTISASTVGPAATSSPITSPAIAAPQSFPTGAYGNLVRYGRDIIENTKKDMPGNVGAAMSCEACHLAAGTKPHGGSYVGIFAEFPQWNKRSKRFISLQDRLAECFLYSENGRPPAYSSREMEALTAYIAWLSRGQPVGQKVTGQGLIAFGPDRKPDPTAGAKVYSQKCTSCHGADGAGGDGHFPPVWGSTSFNDGAGMHRVNTMAAFVRYNMPYGAAPNTLSKQESYDVAEFILSHPRARFNKRQTIQFPAKPASFF
ncbi:MAG: c-type cytochrome [Candidatus Velthaea sp.]